MWYAHCKQSYSTALTNSVLAYCSYSATATPVQHFSTMVQRFSYSNAAKTLSVRGYYDCSRAQQLWTTSTAVRPCDY
eukprot:8491179-Pyramimonas_sp.AAC.2